MNEWMMRHPDEPTRRKRAKALSHNMKALRANGESASAYFHELSKGFIPCGILHVLLSKGFIPRGILPFCLPCADLVSGYVEHGA